MRSSDGGALPLPVTQAFLNLMAKGRYRLGKVHLVEAERLLGRRDTPNACVHAAYYAMHHCAAAALLLAGRVGKSGSVPASHEHVIEHYARLVAGEPEPLANSAEWLNYARASRVTADYGVITGGASIDDAIENYENAKRFFAIFDSRWRLQMPEDEMENLHLTRNLEIAVEKKT